MKNLYLLTFVKYYMFQKIICDSYAKPYDSRITTFVVYTPYIYLLDFYKYPYINISYKVMKEKKYRPSEYKNDNMKDYYYSSIIDFSKSLGDFSIVDISLSYCAIIMTSTKWGNFFYDIRNSKIESIHNYDFMELINTMETNYMDNRKNTIQLEIDGWHIPLNVLENASIIDRISNSFCKMYNFDTRTKAATNEIYNKKFLKEKICTENKNLYNHIAKVPDKFTYLDNGLFDKKWIKSKSGYTIGYNSIYDTWLCLYDILKEVIQRD